MFYDLIHHRIFKSIIVHILSIENDTKASFSLLYSARFVVYQSFFSYLFSQKHIKLNIHTKKNFIDIENNRLFI